MQATIVKLDFKNLLCVGALNAEFVFSKDQRQLICN